MAIKPEIDEFLKFAVEVGAKVSLRESRHSGCKAAAIRLGEMLGELPEVAESAAESCPNAAAEVFELQYAIVQAIHSSDVSKITPTSRGLRSAAFYVEPTRTDASPTVTLDARMYDIYKKHPEECIGWSSRRWARELGLKSHTEILKQPTYRMCLEEAEKRKLAMSEPNAGKRRNGSKFQTKGG